MSLVWSHHLGFFFWRPFNQWILSCISEMTGCVMGHKYGFHGKFTMSCLPKMDSELFWTNFFKQGVKLHQGNTLGNEKCEQEELDFCLLAYIFLSWHLWRSYSLTTIQRLSYFYSPVGTWSFLLASMRGWPVNHNALRSTSTAYHHSAKHNLHWSGYIFFRINSKNYFEY